MRMKTTTKSWKQQSYVKKRFCWSSLSEWTPCSSLYCCVILCHIRYSDPWLHIKYQKKPIQRNRSHNIPACKACCACLRNWHDHCHPTPGLSPAGIALTESQRDRPLNITLNNWQNNASQVTWTKKKKVRIVIQRTLYILVVHEVEKASEQGVGCSVSPSQVNVHNHKLESIFMERRVTVNSLEGEKESFWFFDSIFLYLSLKYTLFAWHTPYPVHPDSSQLSLVVCRGPWSLCAQRYDDLQVSYRPEKWKKKNVSLATFSMTERRG